MAVPLRARGPGRPGGGVKSLPLKKNRKTLFGLKLAKNWHDIKIYGMCTHIFDNPILQV